MEAERLGAGAAWFTEHHGFPDGYLPQPLVLAAATAARTSRLRVGTAVLLAPLRHPRHIAEEAALVDLVSGGRLELGIGAGYAAGEFEAFGADLGGRFRATEGAATEIARLLAAGEVSPAPVQDPLPLWLGYRGPRGARRAGRLGAGLLSLDRRLLAPYRAGLAEGGHDPDADARMGKGDPAPDRAARDLGGGGRRPGRRAGARAPARVARASRLRVAERGRDARRPGRAPPRPLGRAGARAAGGRRHDGPVGAPPDTVARVVRCDQKASRVGE